MYPAHLAGRQARKGSRKWLAFLCARYSLSIDPICSIPRHKMLSALGGQDWENTQGHFGWELHQAKTSNGRRGYEAPRAVAGWYIYWKILRRFKTKTTPFIRGVWKYILSLSLPPFFIFRIFEPDRSMASGSVPSPSEHACASKWNMEEEYRRLFLYTTSTEPPPCLSPSLSPFPLVYHALISGVPLKEGICAWLIYEEGNWSQPMQSCRIIFSKSRKMYATDLKGKRAKEESASKRGEMRKMKTWEKKSAAERKTGIKEGEGHEEDYA